MRWDRLFAELEGQAEDIALDERDALVAELRDEEWSDTGWRDLLGGRVVLEVEGLGRIEGDVVLVNETLIHLSGERQDLLVAASAVRAVVESAQRGTPVGAVGARLGWGQALRAMRDDDDEVRVVRSDGSVVDGAVELVGRDFVRVAMGTGRSSVVPLACLAAVRLRR